MKKVLYLTFTVLYFSTRPNKQPVNQEFFIKFFSGEKSTLFL